MLQKMRSEEFDQVYAIMDRSFPGDEYRSHDAQKALLNDPKYAIYVLHAGDGTVAAFAAVYHFENFAFVEHLAVDPARRNQGLGSVALGELKDLLGCQLCLEVELPETALAQRRIGFYQRNGFYLNHYPYAQPPLSGDKNAVPLLIMTTGDPVDGDAFARLQKTLLEEVYHTNG